MTENFLREKREEKGITMNEMAKILNVAQPMITLYEQGKRRPLLDKVHKMSVVLDVPIEEIALFFKNYK